MSNDSSLHYRQFSPRLTVEVDDAGVSGVRTSDAGWMTQQAKLGRN